MATVKCRLYPTQEQQEKLEQTLDGCSWIYNYFRNKSGIDEAGRGYWICQIVVHC